MSAEQAPNTGLYVMNKNFEVGSVLAFEWSAEQLPGLDEQEKEVFQRNAFELFTTPTDRPISNVMGEVGFNLFLASDVAEEVAETIDGNPDGFVHVLLIVSLDKETNLFGIQAKGLVTENKGVISDKDYLKKLALEHFDTTHEMTKH